MGDATSRKNPLQWEGSCFNRAPVWPREPDLAVIKNNLVKKTEEKTGELGENGAGTGHSPKKELPSIDQNRFGNVAHDEPETDTTAQTAEQAMPTNITTESQPGNGPVGGYDTPWKRLTQEEAPSAVSDATISSWLSTFLEDSIHKVAPGRPMPDGGEKVSAGGSNSGSKYPEETQKRLSELIAKMKKATSSKVFEILTYYAEPAEKTAQMEEEWPTSSNISEAGTDYTNPTEKTVELDDEELPSSSKASEAGSDCPPLVRDVESDWK